MNKLVCECVDVLVITYVGFNQSLVITLEYNIPLMDECFEHSFSLVERCFGVMINVDRSEC